MFEDNAWSYEDYKVKVSPENPASGYRKCLMPDAIIVDGCAVLCNGRPVGDSTGFCCEPICVHVGERI